MIYDNRVKAFLQGENFSNGAKFSLHNSYGNVLYRDAFLLQLVKDKSVLHLGFVDHLPLIDKKIKENSWLHKKLMDVATYCYGIDINQEGIAYLKKKYHYDNMYVLDVLNETIPSEILDMKFDYLVIPDVIEHIGDPVVFLSAIRKKFKNNVGQLVLTTPNAFRLNNFINTFKSIEIINTDHRFWFSPYTLSKIATDAELDIMDMGYFEHRMLSGRQIVRKILLSKYPAFRDTLILRANLIS